MKNKSKKYIIVGIVSLILFLLVGGVIFFAYAQNKKEAKIQAKKLEIEKRERETLKIEVAQLEEKEKELKEQFANCRTLQEKKLIKEKLTSLQNTIFDKKEELKNSAPTSASSSLKDKKNIDKKKLANSLKTELKKELEQRANGT
jgi:flagellar basal body-associated protein FliL